MGVLGASRECLEGLWKVSGRYQENVWRMSESFVEGRVHVYRDGSKARTFLSEASKPPTGARISKGPVGPLKF